MLTTFLLRFFRMEEERHKREMALQLEQAKIEAERRRQEREHELAVLELLTLNAYTATTSMQSSAGPGGYCPSGYEDASHSSRSFAIQIAVNVKFNTCL